MSVSGFQLGEGLGRERGRRVLLSAGTAAIMRGSNVITLLIAIPLVLDYLGTEQFGVWMAIVAIAVLFAFVDLGLGNGLVNAVAAADGRGDLEGARRAISSAYALIVSLAIALSAALVVAYPLVAWPDLVNASDTASGALVAPAVLALLVCVLFSLPATLVQRVQTGLQHGFEANAWAAFAGPLSLCGLLVAMEANATLPWLVAVYVAGPVVASAANSINFFTRRRPDLRPRLSDFDGATARRLLGVGVAFSVLQIAAVSAYQLDALIVANVFGPSRVAIYTVPLQLFLVVPVLVNLFLNALWPAYGESIARGDVSWARRTLARSLWLTLAGTVCAAAVLVVGAPAVIRVWVGNGIDPSLGLLLALAVLVVVTSVWNAVSVFLNGVGVVRLQAFLAVGMLVGKLVLSVAFAKAFGLAGVVWGSIVAQLVFVLIPLALLMPRVMARIAEPVSFRTTLAKA